MKIGILGSRGIPNAYGGFEECAQQLAVRWVKQGHNVSVYNSHKHPYTEKEFQGVQIIHKYDPEHRFGTFGQFIYDLNCLIDARFKKYDVLLLLGYTSSSIWWRLYPRKTRIINNMDGLEWKRSKYNTRTQYFLKKAEKWAAHNCHVMIADAVEIQNYLNEKYKRGAVYIPYGAPIFKDGNPEMLEKYNVEPHEYNLILARLEPENNLEMMLNGIMHSNSKKVTLVIGNHETSYGEYLKSSFKDSRIRFVKASYNKPFVDNLRFYSNIYFHGHSVGGTNPSLLEAMGSQCMILAHGNRFNKEVLGEEGNFFLDATDVATAIDHLDKKASIQKEKAKLNKEKLKNKFNWNIISEQYMLVFEQTRI